MLSPARVKYRKRQRGRRKGNTKRGEKVSFGQFGLQAQTAGDVNSRQIEAARRTITRSLKRGGKVWIRIFPDHPVTKKAAETRMGKGKGAPEFWIFKVKPGRVMFEVGGVAEDVAKKALYLASFKLPIKAKFIEKEVL